MKKLVALSMVFMILLSCEKDEKTSIKLTQDYLPLKVGNKWNFEMAGKDSIIGLTTINGVDYYKFVNDYGTILYYRKQGDKIYTKSALAGSKEEMKFNLSANVNDTWFFENGSVTLANRNSTVVINNVKIDSCLQFDFHNKNMIDYGHSIWLAPGLGFIQKTCQECFGSASMTLKLKQASIDNKSIEFK